MVTDLSPYRDVVTDLSPYRDVFTDLSPYRDVVTDLSPYRDVDSQPNNTALTQKVSSCFSQVMVTEEDPLCSSAL